MNPTRQPARLGADRDRARQDHPGERGDQQSEGNDPHRAAVSVAENAATRHHPYAQDGAAAVWATPFTPDTAPAGLSVRRRVLVAPLFLVLFACAAALIQPSFPRLTYDYGHLVRFLAHDPGLRLPKQASIAVRPLFVALLILFAVFAAGSPLRRLWLLTLSVVSYAAVAIGIDVILARLAPFGAPSPFMAYGNMIAGLVGVVVVACSVFATAFLPGDVRVRRKLPRRRWPLVVLGLAVAITVGCVVAVKLFGGVEIGWANRVPLLGGAGSAVVLFFIVLPALLCVLGAIGALFRGLARILPRNRRTGPWLSIAFVVPARNEETLIGDCVRAIGVAATLYPGRVEVLVVENGSSDRTAAEARAAFAEFPDLPSALLECPPLGKSRALNVGLAQASSDIVIRIDADTLISPFALARIVKHFWDPRVGGVGVLPVPREQRGWIAHMRAVETYYGVAFKRVAQNVVDCVMVLPGATVAYRRSILLELGGFAEGVNGEDADITVRVGRLGYRIVSDWRIKTYTDVPHTLAQLREQRMRWSRGLYHMVGRNRSAIWMRQGIRGTWMLPWASFMMFRKLMLVPFGVAAVGMMVAQPSTLPLREVAAAGAIVIGLQLLQMVVVLLLFGKPSLVAVLPTYLVFRLIVTYFALETLLTLSFSRPRAGLREGAGPVPEVG